LSDINHELEQNIETARSWVDACSRIVVLTGAGISTDSGIQDFRGPKGLWTLNPGAEKMSTIQHYVADPEVRQRRWQNLLETTGQRREPNAGHHAIVDLEKREKLELLITQNVDGLHLDAGTSADRIVEIHGTFREVTCLECAERAPMERALDRVRAGEADPPCRSCGGILKSATISFGQSMIEEDLTRAFETAGACELMLAIGSTLGVFPIANVVPIAQEAGARIVILNGEPTQMDAIADIVIAGSISEVLPRLVSPQH
jgi:NAD-dependent deacetylase